MTINRLILDGYVVSDISLRHSKKGTPVADFRFKHKQPRAKEPMYIDIEVWGRQAEMVADRAKRYSYLTIDGELRMDNWTSKDTGEKRSKHKVTANRIVVIQEGHVQKDTEEDTEPNTENNKEENDLFEL